jgi:hypothetical protein
MVVRQQRKHWKKEVWALRKDWPQRSHLLVGPDECQSSSGLAEEKMANANQEVSNVGASAFKVLCCSICDDPAGEGKVPVPTVDVKVEELDGESGLEECTKMQDTQMFPKVMQLLSDPNIWIGDTRASVDMTPVSGGLTDTRPCGISVHVGSNEHTAATHSGTLSVVCDNCGYELYEVSFPDVHLVPQDERYCLSKNGVESKRPREFSGQRA